MIFVVPYYTKNTKSILDVKQPSITYHMGWFDKKDSDTKKESDVKIDWDAYDRLNNINYKPEDRGTIEVPANAETIIYESPEGQTYEIPVSDLIDADDDGEITYSSKGRSVFNPRYKPRAHRVDYRLKYPTMLMQQQKFARIR
ncbi:MAG: hypothetical protein E7008_01920 [Alphaproteobacteria bacterium]|nr:hypothetical protein [Alphaproteobacteria bacterium]